MNILEKYQGAAELCSSRCKPLVRMHWRMVDEGRMIF